MRDIVTTQDFRHLPPRQRLIKHARNKIRLRFDPEVTCGDVGVLSQRFASGEFADDLLEGEGLDGRELYRVRLWGKKVRVVFDRQYEAVVTVIEGWEAPQFRARKFTRPRAKWVGR